MTPLSVDAFLGLGNNYRVELDINKEKVSDEIKEQITENHRVFEINKIYEKHGDIISELYRKKIINSDKYLSILSSTYKDFNVSKEEMYRLAYGNYYDAKYFNKRPLAKLTKDIALQLKLVE